MIYCNLSGLMANKKVNISEVSRATGISRTTLTSLYYNYFKGIQNDTLDALCKYFNINTDKLLMFSRYDFQVRLNSINSDNIYAEEKTQEANICIDFDISFGEIKKKVSVAGLLHLYWGPGSVSIEGSVEYYDPADEEEESKNIFLQTAISSLSDGIKSYLSNLIESEIIENYDSEFEGRELDISLRVDL